MGNVYVVNFLPLSYCKREVIFPWQGCKVWCLFFLYSHVFFLFQTGEKIKYVDSSFRWTVVHSVITDKIYGGGRTYDMFMPSWRYKGRNEVKDNILYRYLEKRSLVGNIYPFTAHVSSCPWSCCPALYGSCTDLVCWLLHGVIWLHADNEI